MSRCDREAVIGRECIPTAPTYDSPRSYCLLAKQELRLDPVDVDAALRGTVDSYYALGLL